MSGIYSSPTTQSTVAKIRLLTIYSTVFAIFSFTITPMIYLFYPETANRTLEDMDQIFIHNPHPWVFANRAATQSQRPQLYIDAETVRIAEAGNDFREVELTENEKAAPSQMTLEV